MKLKSSIIAVTFALSLAWAFPALAEELGANHQYHDRESCVSARQDRQDLCDKAAELCLEVHQYEAFNKIRPCAHYAQRCQEAGVQEENACFPEANPRVTSNESAKASN
jgi:hypothetical protein